MTRRRNRTTLLGATAVAAVALAGLSGCNPAKGQAIITVSGALKGSVNGPRVTCTNTARIATRTWKGTIDGMSTTLTFTMDKVTGTDSVGISWNDGKGYSAGVFTPDDEDIVTVDSAKVARFSDTIGKASTRITLDAALACP